MNALSMLLQGLSSWGELFPCAAAELVFCLPVAEQFAKVIHKCVCSAQYYEPKQKI